MNKISSSNPKPLEVIIHLVSWFLIFGFPLLLVDRSSNSFDWLDYFRHLKVPMIFAIVFYCNYNWLVPQVLFNKQRKKYFFYNLVLIAIMALFSHFSSNKHPHQNRPPRIHPQRNMQPPPHWIFLSRDIVLMGCIAGLAVAIRMSREWAKAEAGRREAEKNRTEAELSNLRNQLSPHFLLNTLNNIYALIAFDSNKAQEAVQELGQLLRHVLYNNQQTFVPLRQESEFITHYVELMRIRLPKEVSLSFKIETLPEKETMIAPFIFISLIENAFKHGVSTTLDSFISIKLSEDYNGVVKCEILNSNHPKNNLDKSGSGIGLEQVSRRLELLYPHHYEWVRGTNEDGKIYHSILTIYTSSIKPEH